MAKFIFLPLVKSTEVSSSGDLQFFQLPATVPTSEQGLGTNGSAVFISVCLTSLTTSTFNSCSPVQYNVRICWHLSFRASIKVSKTLANEEG
jgi:hypothetical protein